MVFLVTVSNAVERLFSYSIVPILEKITASVESSPSAKGSLISLLEASASSSDLLNVDRKVPSTTAN